MSNKDLSLVPTELDQITCMSASGKRVYEYMMYIIKLHYGGDKYVHTFSSEEPPIESGITVADWKLGVSDLVLQRVLEIRLKPGKVGLV